MNIKDMREYRKKYNLKLIETDDFFNEFGALYDKTYSDGELIKSIKNLWD